RCRELVAPQRFDEVGAATAGDAFEVGVVDLQYRRRAARAETLDLLDREAAFAVALTVDYAQFVFQVIDHLACACQRARQRRAHLQVVLADGVLMIGGVEAHHALDFGSRDADDLCDLVHAGVRDVAFGVLHLPQQGHQRAAATLERVPADDLLQALRLVGEEGYDGVELYHLSTSPSTGSKLAMLMTMSAN